MVSLSDEKIENLLKEEVAKRSLGASVAFTCLSFLVFFYHYGTTRMAPTIQGASVLMLLAALLRLLASRSYVRKQEDSSWKGLQLSIWLNSLSWGVIYGLAAFELRNQGMHFAVLVTMMTGALAGSLVTLANSRTLYLPFLIASLAPVMAVALIQWLSWGQSAGAYLFLAYSVFAVYQLMQFKTVRSLQIDRLKTQVHLEQSLTELKESQDAFVKQTAKLFHASKLSALGEMAGGLSHEVNNSLMRIMGSVDQLDRYLQRDGITAPEYSQKIRNSKEAIQQIKTVIDGLRYFSGQGEDGEKEDRPLKEIIQRTLNFCNELIKANDITMLVAPIPELLVHCNPMQITQILFYLTKNAFDALEGVEDPSRRWIRLSFEVRGPEVEIRVTNGGPLISSDVKSRLFQPFFTTKEVGKGTGLSLSISKGIALAHKGDIYLDDESDFTTFALKIPSAPEASRPHA